VGIEAVLAMTRDKEDTSRAGAMVIIEVGGPVDEARLTLGIHGADLQPEEISALLRCGPTSSHRRGESRRPGGVAFREGAWLLTVEGSAPAEPDDLVRQLLDRLPTDPAVWEQLVAKYTVRVGFGIFIGAWNRGFELSTTSMRQLAVLGVPVGFDIYADGEAEEGNK
jgi:hypothetical protein